MMGEYRTIMNLCRVLPDGLDCKAAVDEAVDCCNDIGARVHCGVRCHATSGNVFAHKLMSDEA